VPVVEVGHGDGLGGSSEQYGIASVGDVELVSAAARAVEHAEVAVLLLPGIGTIDDLERAQTAGATVARIATHCTEADIATQHLAWATTHGLRAIGFLMMSHMLGPSALVEQARMMEAAGASVVYVVDSAGALLPGGVAERVGALREALGVDVGLATTGVAGPDEQEGKPVGTVFIGLALGDQVTSEHARLPGDRNRVRQYSVISALNFLRRTLLALPPA
jgi:4-hydroxy-2-oxovalerate aldolase